MSTLSLKELQPLKRESQMCTGLERMRVNHATMQSLEHKFLTHKLEAHTIDRRCCLLQKTSLIMATIKLSIVLDWLHLLGYSTSRLEI